VADYSIILEELLSSLVKEGQYQDIDVTLLSEGIVAMADGLWLNLLISSKNFKRSDAENVMMQYLRQIFPKHKSAFS